MADAMVTARMSASKKEAGNRVLEKHGTNVSKFFNDMYDYLIAYDELPGKKELSPQERITPAQIEEAKKWIRSFPKMTQSESNIGKSDKEWRRERLEKRRQKYLSLNS